MARIEAVPLLALFSWRAWLRDGWQTQPTVPTTTPPSESKSPKLDSRDQGSRLHSYYLWSFGSTMHSKWKRWANKTGQSCLHSLPADGWWKATQAVLRQPWPPTFSGKCSLRSFHCFSDGGKWRPPVEVSIWIIMSALSLWASAGATARHGITLYSKLAVVVESQDRDQPNWTSQGWLHCLFIASQKASFQLHFHTMLSQHTSYLTDLKKQDWPISLLQLLLLAKLSYKMFKFSNASFWHGLLDNAKLQMLMIIHIQ